MIANLETITGGRVEIASFHFRPWILMISVHGVVIHGQEEMGELPLISVSGAEAGLGLRPFGRQRLRLRHLDIEGLRVHLRTSPQGVVNFPIPRAPTSPQQALLRLLNLSVGRLTVSHSAVFWNNQQRPLELDAGQVAVLVRRERGGYSGNVSSAGVNWRAPGLALPPVTLSGRFEITPIGLSVSSLTWQAPGTSGGASFMVLPRAVLQASGSFHVSLEFPTLSRLLNTPELQTGTVKVEGLATYEKASLTARGRVQARQLTVFQPGRPSVTLDAASNYTYENEQLELNGLLASLWNGTLQGTLHASLQQSPASYSLDARLRGVRIENALKVPNEPPVMVLQLHPGTAADGDLRAVWSDRGEHFNASFAFTLRAPEDLPPGVLPLSGAMRGFIENRAGLTIHLTDSEYHLPHSTVTVHGALVEAASSPPPAEPLALTIHTNNFEEWQPLFQTVMQGSPGVPLQLISPAVFDGEVTGSAEVPALAGKVSLGQFRYRGWTWDRLTAAVTLDPELVKIAGARMARGKSSFALDAAVQLEHWRLKPGSMIRASASAQHTPIEGLRAALNLDAPLNGMLTGRVDVSGTQTTLSGSGSVRIEDGVFAGEPFDSFSTPLQITRAVWKLPNIQLIKQTGRISGELTLEPQRRFASGRLNGTGFRLADMHRLPASAALAASQGRLNGSLNFEAQGHGTPEDFHLRGSWRLAYLSVADMALGEFDGTFAGEGKQLTLEGREQSPAGQALRVHAKTTAGGDWPIEAEGEYTAFRADPWFRAFLGHDFAAGITLDGSFQARGSGTDPAKLKIASHSTRLAVDFPSAQWRNVQTVEATLERGRLSLSQFVMRGPATELEIAGTVDVEHDLALALSVDGAANATLLTMFEPELQANGRSTLHVRVTGTPARPLVNGTLNVDNVGLESRGQPLRFSSLQGVIGFEGERAVIRSLHGTSGGGGVDFHGAVAYAGTPRFDLTADLSQVRLPYPDNFTSVLDGRLRLGGSAERAELRGDLLVRQMIPAPNINLIGKMIESSGPVSELPGAGSSAFGSKLRLNVRVTSVPPVQVRTPNFRLVGDIDVRLEGTVANPVQVGSIHFLNGDTVFRGNRFTLVRGDINLVNPLRTQAYLDLEAETRVQSYNLTLDITGPFDRLKFAYRSDPPLSQTDIVSLLALGYVPQEQAFPAFENNRNATSSVGASAILSEALSSQIGGRIQHLFGVSRIKIDPYVGMPGLGSGERVTVEQQITHELTLTYTTDTSYSQYTIVQFEWQVSNNVSILGVRDPNGIFGIEFRFHQRFK